MSQKHHV